jgi:hypothetical protein
LVLGLFFTAAHRQADRFRFPLVRFLDFMCAAFQAAAVFVIMESLCCGAFADKDNLTLGSLLIVSGNRGIGHDRVFCSHEFLFGRSRRGFIPATDAYDNPCQWEAQAYQP